MDLLNPGSASSFTTLYYYHRHYYLVLSGAGSFGPYLGDCLTPTATNETAVGELVPVWAEVIILFTRIQFLKMYIFITWSGYSQSIGTYSEVDHYMSYICSKRLAAVQSKNIFKDPVQNVFKDPVQRYIFSVPSIIVFVIMESGVLHPYHLNFLFQIDHLLFIFQLILLLKRLFLVCLFHFPRFSFDLLPLCLYPQISPE